MADEGLSRRVKAPAGTAPLHELDARKGMIEWAEVLYFRSSQ
ncbi:hypothetical protein [Streptomyces sp. NPDC046805]